MANKQITTTEIIRILDLLKQEYPDAGCALKHRNIFELIVCVVLSAQTTDVSVNKVTRGGSDGDIKAGITVRREGEGLFDIYPDAESLASARQDDVMEIIRTIGMYKTKASNIIKLAKELVAKHEGQVPEDYDALVALPGVGRKTANVVLAVGFGHQRIAVDTHVFRVSHRIGLAGGSTCGSARSAMPAKTGGSARAAGAAVSDKEAAFVKTGVSAKSAGAAEVLATEHELMKVLPEERWSEAHHSLIWHGRSCCTARNPKCHICIIRELCAAYNPPE